jgi:2-(1,2-epoxy-1,2-dihydrophenyl)acetyl-CoA isomerase
MSFTFLQYEVKNKVAWIRLNMLQKMNALEAGLFGELSCATTMAAQDPEVKCLVLTGTGPAFCAGGDINRFNEGFTLKSGQEYVKSFNPFIREFVNMEKPTIAAVNGYAVGAGFCLAILCDVIYASENAKFGLAFRNVGLLPDLGGMYFLPRLVGLSKAKELTFTGRNIDASEAEKIGIVSKVFRADEFEVAVGQSAEIIASGPTFALKEAKKILNASMQISLEEVLLMESYAQGMCFQTKDVVEGILAFLEKRKAQFKGE